MTSRAGHDRRPPSARRSGVLGTLAGALALIIVAPGPGAAQESPDVDLAAVERELGVCGDNRAADFLRDLLAAHGLDGPPASADRDLALAVSRAIEPERLAEEARESLRSLVTRHADKPESLDAIRYYVLEDLALFREVNCESLRRWYRHLVVYGDLAARAASDDPNLAYYRRAAEGFRNRLAVALRAGRRMRERSALYLSAVALGGD